MRIQTLAGALLLAAALLPAAPRSAAAQIFTPAFLAPVRGADTGIHLEDGFSGSDGIAVELIWRRGYGAYDLGLRGGIADQGEGAGILLGADYRNPLEIDVAPLAVAITGGAQVVVGEESGFGVDAGVTVGSTFTFPQLAVTPFLHPRLGLVDGVRAGDELGLEVLADVGAEVTFAPNFVARLSLGFGDPTASFGIGLAWR